MTRREDAMKTQQRVPRRRHHGGKTAERLDGRHHALGHAATAHFLGGVRNIAVAPHPKTRTPAA